MSSRPISAAALRAARLSRLPGVTIAEAAGRFRVSATEVKRARRDAPAESALSSDDFLLSALTGGGRSDSGELGDLEGIASWLDYVNHDGTQASEVRTMLATLVEKELLAIEGNRWSLRKPWP